MLSSSVSPSGTCGFGMLGILNIIYSIFESISLTLASNSFIVSPIFFISAITSVTSSPAFFLLGISAETWFLLPFKLSTSTKIDLLSSSNAITSSITETSNFSPLLPRAFLISSALLLILFKSNILLTPFLTLAYFFV